MKTTATATDCPCASGKPFASCCGPYLSGSAAAPTAQALMRARYSAYATGNIDFIEKTHDPEAGSGFDRAAAEKWSRESTWNGLEIVGLKDGGENDSTGIVNFVAHFSAEGQDYAHRELSSFRKVAGAWVFVEGRSPKAETFVKSGPDLGRNDPCSCGSGKKFKKCHGRPA